MNISDLSVSHSHISKGMTALNCILTDLSFGKFNTGKKSLGLYQNERFNIIMNIMATYMVQGTTTFAFLSLSVFLLEPGD